MFSTALFKSCLLVLDFGWSTKDGAKAFPIPTPSELFPEDLMIGPKLVKLLF